MAKKIDRYQYLRFKKNQQKGKFMSPKFKVFTYMNLSCACMFAMLDNDCKCIESLNFSIYNLDNFQHYNIIEAKMEEYMSNIDFLDVLDYLTFNPQQESQALSINSLQMHQSMHNNGTSQFEESHKRELPTSTGSFPIRNMNQPSTKKVRTTMREEIEFQWEVKERYLEVKKGSKDDTMELNINFKTIFINHFKNLQQANELSPDQSRRVSEFGRRPPSFKSLITFCVGGEGSKEISMHCLKLVESSAIMSQVLSSRCCMITKMQMIKFAEVLRANLKGEGRIRRWKQSNYK